MAETANPRGSRKARPKRRWLRWIGLFGLFLLLAGAAEYGVWYARAKAKLDAEIAAVRSRGEPVAFEELSLPQRESPATTRLREALSRLPTLHYQPIYEELFPGPASTWPRTLAEPGDYPNLRAALRDNREAIETARSLLSDPEVRFCVDCSVPSPCEILLPHVDKLKSLGEWLLAEVVQSLGAHNRSAAVEAMRDMFAAADLLGRDTFIVSQLGRRSLQMHALDALQSVLQTSNLDERERQRLDDWLREAELKMRMHDALIGERAALYGMLEPSRMTRFGDLIAGAAPRMERVGYSKLDRWLIGFDAASTACQWEIYRPKLFESQAIAIRYLSRFAELVDEPGPAAADRWTEACQEYKTKVVVCSDLFPWVESLRASGLRHRQRLLAARLGLRVDAFRRSEGRLPETLDAVLDDHLRSVSAALLSGEALRYDREENGFRIYDDHDPEPLERDRARGAFHVRYRPSK